MNHRHTSAWWSLLQKIYLFGECHQFGRTHMKTSWDCWGDEFYSVLVPLQQRTEGQRHSRETQWKFYLNALSGRNRLETRWRKAGLFASLGRTEWRLMLRVWKTEWNNKITDTTGVRWAVRSLLEMHTPRRECGQPQRRGALKGLGFSLWSLSRMG